MRLAPEQLAVRTEAHEFQGVGVRLAIDQQQIRPHVAFAAPFPGAQEPVVATLRRQPFIGEEQHDERAQQFV